MIPVPRLTSVLLESFGFTSWWTTHYLITRKSEWQQVQCLRPRVTLCAADGGNRRSDDSTWRKLSLRLVQTPIFWGETAGSFSSFFFFFFSSVHCPVQLPLVRLFTDTSWVPPDENEPVFYLASTCLRLTSDLRCLRPGLFSAPHLFFFHSNNLRFWFAVAQCRLMLLLLSSQRWYSCVGIDMSPRFEWQTAISQLARAV